MDWHSMSTEEVLKNLSVEREYGLNSKQIKDRSLNYGKNKITEKKKKSLLMKFLEQFSDFMIIILLVAAGISFVTALIDGSKDYIDSIIILIIVILNSITGVIQESKAEKAIDALKKLSAPHSKVIRNGNEVLIDSEDLVPGDILILHTGDFIAADARIIKANSLKVEESSLTGESVPVEKNDNKKYNNDTQVADRKNMLFSSSVITSGNAVAVVVETGMNTQVGKIAYMLDKEEAPQTPLQKKLADTGKFLGLIVMIICLGIFILGLIQKTPPLDMFMISISLAVAAIPEGLPTVVTIVLAIGVRRMAANKAIIRKLPAVETLGSASVICSDKTGTLTQNKMTVKDIRDLNGKVDLNSKFSADILAFSALCNNSKLKGEPGNWSAAGEPTETALVVAAAKAGKKKNDLDAYFPRVLEIPFDSTYKFMTTVHSLGNGNYRVITKGAADILIRKCKNVYNAGNIANITDFDIKKIEKSVNEMASQALRVLAIAYKDITYMPTKGENIANDLCFYGLIGMIDPPRPQAKDAVRDCQKAGIKPVMITGDHVITAKAIAKELGIFQENDMAITGKELDQISQKDLEEKIYSYSVFARVSPEHKVRIVKAFQENGKVVAMTGDGVNDAPALKAADIGCAMGISGTDVAKGAADMIMTDDNFATIVEAVRQGRGIFENIKKTIHFLISSNIGEIITVLSAFLLRMPAPILAIQLLWVNLVTDSLPALALGVDPVDQDIMEREPVDAKKSLFSGAMAYNIAIEGMFIGAISLLAFVIGRSFFDVGSNPVIARTMAFSVLSFSELVHAFNVRSEKSVFKFSIFNNIKMLYSFVICIILQISVVSVESLSMIFKTAQLDLLQWIIVILLSLCPLIVAEVEKYVYSIKLKKECA